jgi:cytochrome P450
MVRSSLSSDLNTRITKNAGPIVRIRPDVIHINDPEYIDQVYAGAGKRRDKYKIAVGGFATPGAALGTPGHDLHRSRRAAMNPYFSKQSIRRVEPMIQRTLAKVLGRLDQNAKSGIPMKMNILYSATTGDIITEYAFGESSHNLDREDLNEPYFTAFDEAGKGFHFASHVPIFVPIISTIPTRLALFLKPAIEVFLILIKVKAIRLYDL